MGHVGTGFDMATLTEIHSRLAAIKTENLLFLSSSCAGIATWVRPELVAEVKFAEITREGYLRAPVFLRYVKISHPLK